MTKSQILRKIRSARRKLRYSYADAADEIGMERGNWCAIESGNRPASWELIIRMGDAVGLKITVNSHAHVEPS